jgi:aspartate aminotransferase
MKLSDRIHSVQPSMTLAISTLAQEMKARGEDIIGFGAGEPDFPTPDNIKQAAIRGIQENDTHYTPVGGTPALKKAIVDKFQTDNQLRYEASQIVVSCGAKHSFYNLAQVLWQAGDEIIIPAPYWVSYPDMVLLAGATPVIVGTSEKAEFKITPDQLAEAVTPNTRAVVLNSPSNPTGSAYTRAELEALAECALRHRLLIISDEIYEKIVFDSFQHVSIASLSEEVKKSCVVINGVSKAYAMTGWRIGYLAAEPEIAKAVGKLQGQSTSNPTSISQAATVEALTGPQDAVARMAKEFEQRRNITLNHLKNIPGVTCYSPVGAFYSFPDFSSYYGKSFEETPINGSLELGQYLLQEAKVALVPGVAFGADANARLSFATSEKNIETGLTRIAEGLSQLR